MESSKYQTFWLRLGAVFGDGIILAIADVVVSGLVVLIGSSLMQAIWSSLHYFLYDLYFIYMHGKHGQTIGKRQMGLVVRSVDGERLRWGQAFRRNAVSLGLGAIGLLWISLAETSSPEEPARTAKLLMAYPTVAWLLAETITVIATEKRRAIHDYIAGSVVVRVEIRGPAIEQPGGSRRKN